MSRYAFTSRLLKNTCAAAGTLIGTLLIASAAHASSTLPTIVKPLGTYADASSLNSAVVYAQQNQGVLIRAPWNALEPSPGVFNMTAITNQLALIKSTNTPWSLAVVAGPSSPTWLYAAPYYVKTLTVSTPNGSAVVPQFWDANLQTQLSGLATALAKQFASNPNLKLIYLPQMSANGVEGHFNGTSDTTLTSQGFTSTLWANAVIQAAVAFGKAFPLKPIAIELHYILSSASAGQSIMQSIKSNPAMLNQIGVAMWWLSGKTSYQPDLLTAFSTFPGQVYAQLIDQSANTSSFLNNDYTTAYTQAEQLHIRYVEPWDADVSSQKWVSLFQSFNTYAGAP